MNQDSELNNIKQKLEECKITRKRLETDNAEMKSKIKQQSESNGNFISLASSSTSIICCALMLYFLYHALNIGKKTVDNIKDQ